MWYNSGIMKMGRIEVKCLCGKKATHTAYLPMPNVFALTKQVMEPHKVCEYHAAKAKLKGYAVEEGVT